MDESTGETTMMKIDTSSISKPFTDIDWRFLILIVLPFILLIYLSFSYVAIPFPFRKSPGTRSNRSSNTSVSSLYQNQTDIKEVERSRIAFCLVGGARRFELTGPSIIENLLKQYKNSDLFLHSPLDGAAYKFSLLKAAPRLAAVRIFSPSPLRVTEAELRVLTSNGSPNGIQGLLQYFNLVEGCRTLINAYEAQHNFTYDWIVRTRVDGYWSAPLSPTQFSRSEYVVPSGSQYKGLNDRLGIGDPRTSRAALSRLSLIPLLDAANYRELNSESAFKAQLTVSNVAYRIDRFPFCIVSDRSYQFPPVGFGVPVASMNSPGPLSGAKCRPCKPVCIGPCVADVMGLLYPWWSQTDWQQGSLELCDASGPWEEGWEQLFDGVAGKKNAQQRKKMASIGMNACVKDLEALRNKTGIWDAPEPSEICRLGLASKAG